MDNTLDVIYQAGVWAIIGIMVLYGTLRNRYPSTLAAIKKWLGKFAKAEPEIVAVKYLDTVTRPAQGSYARVALTNLMFGLLEALAVASLEGQDVYHRFAVYYDNGKEKIIECQWGTEQFNALVSLASWEDL